MLNMLTLKRFNLKHPILDAALRVNRPTNDQMTSDGHFETSPHFNLSEVYHIAKEDKNVQAYVLNKMILYTPVLICDVLLWVVIVRLLQHIRRQIISNRPVVNSERMFQEVNSDGGTISGDKSTKTFVFDDESGNVLDDCEEEGSSDNSEFLCLESGKTAWYTPGYYQPEEGIN